MAIVNNAIMNLYLSLNIVISFILNIYQTASPSNHGALVCCMVPAEGLPSVLHLPGAASMHSGDLIRTCPVTTSSWGANLLKACSAYSTWLGSLSVELRTWKGPAQQPQAAGSFSAQCGTY